MVHLHIMWYGTCTCTVVWYMYMYCGKVHVYVMWCGECTCYCLPCKVSPSNNLFITLDICCVSVVYNNLNTTNKVKLLM